MFYPTKKKINLECPKSLYIVALALPIGLTL